MVAKINKKNFTKKATEVNKSKYSQIHLNPSQREDTLSG